MIQFYLNFKNDATGLVEITEPVKFDGASFTVEQDKGRYGRDISYGNEEVSLEFYDGTFENGLTMGLTPLLDFHKNYGFESEVEFIIKKDGVVFTVGLLDFQMAKTDLITFFECKVIQENNRAIINRRKDVNVNVFSDKDLDLNPITPLATKSILLKAKPVVQNSNWISNDFGAFAGRIPPALNTAVQLVKSNIENTLTPFSIGASGGFLNYCNTFRYVYALNNLTKIKLKIDVDIDLHYETELGTLSSSAGFKLYYAIFDYPAVLSPFPLNVLIYEKTITGTTIEDFNLTTVFDVEIDNIEVGKSLSIFFDLDWDTAHLDRTFFNFKKVNLDISATSTAIDSVIKGVRYIDLFKQNVKSISGLTVDAPRFDIAGEFYEQFAFNGKLIRQFEDKAFYVNFKDLTEGLQEVNSDYQINQTNVFLGKYDDFYTNIDLGGFLQSPDSEFTANFNERYAINTFDYSYKTFEQNRDESNTVDSIHTNTQFLLPNKLVENTKKIEVNHIRDPFAIESARRQGVNTKESTSLDNDDKLFLIDVYPLPDGSMGGFDAKLLMRINDGKLEILNNTLNGDGTSFNWTLLGFDVGSNFEILEGVNIGTYTVDSITPTNLLLIGSPTIEGDHFIKVEYPLTNVNYVNRTNEGFTSIEKLSGGDNFSNLRYSIKRNMNHWKSYLKTATKYKPNGIIQNTFFKNNGEVSTLYGAETIPTIEGANINVTDLSDAILSPMFYKTKVVDTNEAVIKLHPTKLDYEWSTNLLTIEGEKRNESDYTTINTIGTELIEINEVGYNITLIKGRWFKIDGYFVTLYDLNSVPLINRTRFDKIKVNGVVYDSIVTLSDALNGL